MTRILAIAGTRPEAIKMAPIVEQLQKSNADFGFVWSGQHYHYDMSRVFFDQLGLPEPDENLDIRSGTDSEQTAKAMVKLKRSIDRFRPSVIISQGDTNTVAAAAMTSVKSLVPFAHVEAGLRSWNMAMPEEINRRIADSIASLHFAPTRLAALNLVFEGVPARGLHLTGNTIVDIVYKHLEKAKEVGKSLIDELNFANEKYLLVTLHRAENTDNLARLRSILFALRKLANEFDVAFPVHPRTERRMSRLGLRNPLRGIAQLTPLSYWGFLGLLMNASLVLTDSGGVQEEACILRVPAVTLRYDTERPETLLYGNVLAGTEPETIVDLAHKQLALGKSARKYSLENPFGDGHAGERIVNLLRESVEKGLKIEGLDMRKAPIAGYRLQKYTQATPEEHTERLAWFDESGLPHLTAEASDRRVDWFIRRREPYGATSQ
jgi:UDP-N-acetylglucosamine 2-epimerase (non-hydrolysing)